VGVYSVEPNDRSSHSKSLGQERFNLLWGLSGIEQDDSMFIKIILYSHFNYILDLFAKLPI